MCGLVAWKERAERLFSPIGLFASSGTYSDPAFNPIPDVPVINAGVEWDSEFSGHRRHYGKAAFTAGFAFAANRGTEWDILIHYDHDAFIGDINLDSLIREFWDRPEILCCSQTCGNPEGPLTLMKHSAVCRLLHYRQYPNLHDPEEEITPVWDQEMGYIFRGGRWWNPWPDFKDPIHIGRDHDQYGWNEMLTWPMVVKPTEAFARIYTEVNSCKTKPYRP